MISTSVEASETTRIPFSDRSMRRQAACAAGLEWAITIVIGGIERTFRLRRLRSVFS